MRCRPQRLALNVQATQLCATNRQVNLTSPSRPCAITFILIIPVPAHHPPPPPAPILAALPRGASRCPAAPEITACIRISSSNKKQTNPEPAAGPGRGGESPGRREDKGEFSEGAARVLRLSGRRLARRRRLLLFYTSPLLNFFTLCSAFFH